ncbi:PP0621 family protein [Nitratifractor salsuginis]|uniref:Prokaryotic metallothionein n=1 Tax=Nitratifractor salsuginis (strain DSM 16511 / JCM 12458 / E9I37-1) TaxID=749222 RepID=E6X2F5_NITSE|nr:PP0621 family protein [Nitratifractor salsuginis]ADV47160.1 hypothetical protein Nitsa_1916 [Nitratifractor salsuginis DSM 16511]
MWLKLLIIGAILYGLYRLTGGRILPKSGSGSSAKAKGKDPVESGEELVECSKCSTYVVKREAILFKGKYYCSAECLPSKH